MSRTGESVMVIKVSSGFSAIGLIFGGMLIAAPSFAKGAPEQGCYHRDYSRDHLKENPDQVVSAMRLKIYDSGNERHAAMEVQFANQGHAGRDGHGNKQMKQYLVCFSNSGGAPTCGVECDGGQMRLVKQDGAGLTFETDYLMVGETEQCGGAVDLAEHPGQSVRYRLNRAGPNICSDM
ncbi:MAG: hypothetical protein ABJN26_18505 [Stappiaceae bacterium]